MDIKRIIFNKLNKDYSEKKSTILVGPRQVGKTTLLHHIENDLASRGVKTAFFDLEQPDILAQFNKPDVKILSMLRTSGQAVFIDEFQYLKNASKIFKAIYDAHDPIKIFASGSSAMEIHSHLKESLAGRKHIIPIHPCNLAEISQVIPADPFSYYCIYGGMPGTTQTTDPDQKKQLLLDILQSYILKDIKALIREENIRAFNHLMYLLAQAQGNLIVVDGLARDVGLSPHTINSYLDILSQTYVNFSVPSYSRNLGNELKKSKKYYLYDIGIRNALLKNFADLTTREDGGTIAETFVFLELQQHLTPETEIRFWRLKNGTEVDFLWIKNQIPYPIEVKLNWSPPTLPNGLVAFLNRYPKTKKAFVVSNLSAENISYNTTEISFIKFEKAWQIPDMIV